VGRRGEDGTRAVLRRWEAERLVAAVDRRPVRRTEAVLAADQARPEVALPVVPEAVEQEVRAEPEVLQQAVEQEVRAEPEVLQQEVRAADQVVQPVAVRLLAWALCPA
jgi:hypothetical protein